jgi:TRAP-type C4-dicarboxylate transport system permease large subunit
MNQTLAELKRQNRKTTREILVKMLTVWLLMPVNILMGVVTFTQAASIAKAHFLFVKYFLVRQWISDERLIALRKQVWDATRTHGL